jgi:hypothetical protein
MGQSSDRRNEDQRRLYEERYVRYGDDAQALLHAGQDSQFERFDQVSRCFSRETGTFSVHEIGCALGHFGGYLRERYPRAVFSGSDVSQTFVDACRARFPGGEFHVRDITSELPEDRYDYVVTAGTFDILGTTPHDEWQSFIYAMLAAMYAIARKGIGATFLTGYSDPGRERPDMFYQDEKTVLDWAKRNLSRHVEIDGSGPLYEYGLRVYRPEYVRALFPQSAFDRYFRNLKRDDAQHQ